MVFGTVGTRLAAAKTIFAWLVGHRVSSQMKTILSNSNVEK